MLSRRDKASHVVSLLARLNKTCIKAWFRWRRINKCHRCANQYYNIPCVWVISVVWLLHRILVLWHTNTSKAIHVFCALTHCSCNAPPLLALLSKAAMVSVKCSLLFVLVLLFSGRTVVTWVTAVLNINEYSTGGVEAGQTYAITYSSADNTVNIDCSGVIGHVLIKCKADNVHH